MSPAPLSFETFLRVRAATGGTFSPDGRTLAFLLNTPGVPQAFRLDAPGSAAVQLTHFTEIARALYWSPDGSRLIFTMDAGGSEREQLYLLAPDGSECRLLTRNPEAIHSFGAWSPDGARIAYAANIRNPAHFDIYVMDVETGAAERVLEQDATLQVLAWSPDGQSLLIRSQPTSFDSDLHLLDLASGSVRCVTAHPGEARQNTPRFVEGGRALLLSTDQGRDFFALCRLELESGKLTPLLAEDADVECCDVSEDGSRFVALLNRQGWSEVVLGRLEGSAARIDHRIDRREVIALCRMAPDGSRVAISANAPARNFDVWSIETDSGEVRRWTSAPMEGLDPAALAEPELIHYPTHDGRAIPAWLYCPRRESAGPAPVVLHVHGGPESQDRPNFNPVYQYLIHHGFAVLAPNVRGSAGYGNAYCRADDVEKRYDALRDVEQAYHWLVGSGIGDPRRIAIMGASYGGFTVLACLTRWPDLWAAGVDIVGIANFETFFKHTGPWRRHLRASEYGDPERDRELLRDLSPIHAVDRILAPLMVIQGANDPRVPQEESDQMVERLRARSHPVEYLLFPDEGHGIVKLPNRLKAYTAIAAFLDRYLR